VPLVIAMGVVALLLLFMWIAVRREPGPGPSDVAIAYERAWNDLDFNLLYDLSGEEMRDGLRRERFVRAKQSALGDARTRGKHPRAAVTVETTIAGHQTALVVTSVTSGDAHVHNNVVLEKRANGWVVVGYTLRPETEADKPVS